MFQAISSWFSSRDTTPSRRTYLMNSTQDAFSLPTHSSSLPPPTTPYATRTPSSEAFDLEPPSAAAYTYPPPPRNDDSYGYLPNPAFDSSRSTNPSSILPLHHPHPHSRGHYPPLTHTWTRIRTWLTDEYPELGDTLNYGVLPEILHEVELTLGFTLPASVRESYLTTDGQEPESITGVGEGLFYGLSFLSLEDALEEWKFWRTVDDDPTTGANHRLRSAMQSIPPGFVRREYSNRGWFPLVSDKAGNYLGVDMNPDQEGSVGQVIIFGRDFDMKVVVCSGEGEGGWGKWLANFAEELEAGDAFEIGNADSSDGSDDGLGYDSYFNDGSRTRGHNSASAGLRLTGEFRGWPVLEAWGTRSYRQWVESGHMAPDPEEGNSRAAGSSGPASQPLPPSPPPKESSPNTPTITSKLPAPQLVEVPTPHDILHHPLNSPSDLEIHVQSSEVQEDQQQLLFPPDTPHHDGKTESETSTPIASPLALYPATQNGPNLDNVAPNSVL